MNGTTTGGPSDCTFRWWGSRWNSTFEMIERILEQEQAISAVLVDSGKRDLILSSDEFDCLLLMCWRAPS